MHILKKEKDRELRHQLCGNDGMVESNVYVAIIWLLLFYIVVS